MRKIATVLGVVIMIGGIMGLAYPSVSNYLYNKQHKNVIWSYQEDVTSLDEAEKQRILDAAHAYNDELYKRNGTVTQLNESEAKEYDNVLDVSDSGIMGYLDIPKISVFLPIYHGTDEAVLQQGIGHLEGSSLPVGGANTHTVLTGHSGLWSAKLFTDLDELETGDTFMVSVLNDVLTYEVDSIKVVLPQNSKITIDEDCDYCTLITCTPVGVNSHRLLVRGHRIPTESGVNGTSIVPNHQDANSGMYTGIFACVMILALAVCLVVVIVRKRRSR